MADSLFSRLQIESHSSCNRTCWFCPRTYDRSGRYRNQFGKSIAHRMPTELILNIMDQASEMCFSGGITFNCYSEPLLDDRNIMLAREAKERGMRPYLHTNGDVLKISETLCKQVRDVYEYIVVGVYDYETNEELGRSNTIGATGSQAPISGSAQLELGEEHRPLAWQSPGRSSRQTSASRCRI